MKHWFFLLALFFFHSTYVVAYVDWDVPAQTIQNDARDVVSLATDRSGLAIGAWNVGSEINSSVIVKFYTNGVWTDSLQIENARNPKVAISSSMALVVWLSLDSKEIYAKVFKDGSWGNDTLLSLEEIPESVSYCELALRDTNAIVAWNFFDGLSHKIQVSTYDGISWTFNGDLFATSSTINTNPLVTYASSFAICTGQIRDLSSTKLVAKVFKEGSWGTEHIIQESSNDSDFSQTIGSSTNKAQIVYTILNDNKLYATNYNGTTWSLSIETEWITYPQPLELVIEESSGDSCVTLFDQIEGFRPYVTFIKNNIWQTPILLTETSGAVPRMAVYDLNHIEFIWADYFNEIMESISYTNGVLSAVEIIASGYAFQVPGIGFVSDTRLISLFFGGSDLSNVVQSLSGTFMYSPPSVFTVSARQDLHRYVATADLVNVITWTPDTLATSYQIYLDQNLTQKIATILPTQTLEFQQHQRKKNQAYTYYITFTKGGIESDPVKVILGIDSYVQYP